MGVLLPPTQGSFSGLAGGLVHIQGHPHAAVSLGWAIHLQKEALCRGCLEANCWVDWRAA